MEGPEPWNPPEKDAEEVKNRKFTFVFVFSFCFPETFFFFSLLNEDVCGCSTLRIHIKNVPEKSS